MMGVRMGGRENEAADGKAKGRTVVKKPIKPLQINCVCVFIQC
jgi:hypothetical protein